MPTFWWRSWSAPYAFARWPSLVWFWDCRPDWNPEREWPPGYCWFYKIPPSNGYHEQLAFRWEVDTEYHADTSGYYRANVIYIHTYAGEPPQWGTISDWTQIGHPCANYGVDVYMKVETTRSQTWRLGVAVQSDRDNTVSVPTAVAKTGLLELSAVSAVQGNVDLELDMDAVIRGDADRTFLARAAIRDERTLEESVVSAVATEFGDTVDVETAIQGNPYETVAARAAILGEAECEVTIKTVIVKDRTEAILLELENTWPQEFYFVSVPNWRSSVKDYRTDSIG